MAEETKVGEGENLNSEGQGDQAAADAAAQAAAEAAKDQKTTFTLDEVEAMKKKMQSDGDKGVQELLKAQKRLEKVIDGVAKISADPKALLEINESDPDVVKAILDKYYGGKSLEEYQEMYKIKVDYSDPAVVERRIKREAEKLAENTRISEKKDEFVKRLNMTPEEVKLFNEAFEERKSLKSFKIEDLAKHLEKAYKEIDGDPANLKELEKQAIIGKSQATNSPSGQSSKTVEQPLKKNREEAKSFLSKHNI